MASSKPQFRHPPVIETVMGVHFRPISQLSSAKLGVFWDRSLRNDFPSVEERPIVDEPTVRFGDELLSDGKVGIRWQVGSVNPIRLWLKSDDGCHILQLQQGAILANWLCEQQMIERGDLEYVDYTARAASFAERFDTFSRFVRDEADGCIDPTLCVVRYINHIPLEKVDQLAEAFAGIFPMWQNKNSDGWLPASDIVQLKFGYPLPNRKGRLDATASPSRRVKDGKPVIRLDIQAHIAPSEKTSASALEALDTGHEWVVNGFASMTDTDMHAEWGRH